MPTGHWDSDRKGKWKSHKMKPETLGIEPTIRPRYKPPQYPNSIDVKPRGWPRGDKTQAYSLFVDLRKMIKARTRNGWYKNRLADGQREGTLDCVDDDLEDRLKRGYDPLEEIALMANDPRVPVPLRLMAHKTVAEYVHIPLSTAKALEQSLATGAPIIIQIAPWAAGASPEVKVIEQRVEKDVTPDDTEL